MRLPARFTSWDRLFRLWDRLAAHRAQHRNRRVPLARPSFRLHLEAFEERLVPHRPLPSPVIVVGSGAGMAGTVTEYAADTGDLIFTHGVFGSFTGGVRVAAGDFNGDGFPDVVAATGPAHRLD